SNRIVGATRELAISGEGSGFRVLPHVRLVDRWRHQVIVATRDEEQRRPVALSVIHLRLGVRVEKRQRSVPKNSSRAGNLEPVVNLLRFGGIELVREGVIELGRAQ